MGELETIYNYLELTDSLSTAGQPDEAELAAVARAGFQVVINLAMERDEYSPRDEAGTARALGMEYEHLPVVWTHPTRERFEAFRQAMKRHEGQKVFVHCAANMRVSVFTALYRILELGWTRDEAMGWVQKIWEPNETWQGFIEEMIGPASSERAA